MNPDNEVWTACPNCYRDYPDRNPVCEECGHDTKEVDSHYPKKES